jgi:hypothetical protein
VNKLFEYVHPTEIYSIRSSGLAVFRTLFEFATYNQVEYILKIRSDILDMFVHNLIVENQAADILSRTLKCLISLVKLYNNIYTPVANNKIVYQLDRIQPI